MLKKKASSIPPKLTEAEQDLLAHMEQGYRENQFQADDEVFRPLSANRNTIKALEERGLLHSGQGRDPLTMVWHINKKR